MYQLKAQIKKLDKVGMLFILPSLLIVLLLLIYPVISSLYFSFTSKNLIKSNYDLVGFQNFIFVLSSKEFYEALWTSVKWTVLSILGQVFSWFYCSISTEQTSSFFWDV
ncbi:hypothetical protein ACFZL3_000995 [Staphylococcus pseudintermedius]